MMHAMTAGLMVSLVSASIMAVQRAAVAADIDNGRRLVEARCLYCHAVAEAPGARAKPGGPRSLESIANSDRVDVATIAAFLRMPHARMPNFVLGPRDADDIAAYVVQFKSR